VSDCSPGPTSPISPLPGQHLPPALHAAAYNLVNFFRHQWPQPWRSAQIETLRARLFNISARIRHTARCIRIHLATGWPFPSLFRELALAFHTG